MKLVSDGKVVEKNLKEAGVTLSRLNKQLQSKSLHIEDTFYVELQKDGTLYVDKRKDNLSHG